MSTIDKTTGHVPDTSTVALLFIDFINDLEFVDGEKLYPHALEAAKKAAALKQQAKDHNIPVIYVNDNYGRWQSNFEQIIQHCLQKEMRGSSIVSYLEPDREDYFVLKPQFSGFFFTPLELLLEYLDVKTLIIAGVATNMCVQFTANDAYMRKYDLIIPEDCSASNTNEDHNFAIRHLQDVLKADTTPQAELDMPQIIEKAIAYYQSCK
ncbi:cysteine hydrolase family protein [Salsuginibacillus kocurii]|uniref:cysteine hydrolase family protein n=1 Tax=Salsuginibacillus kocurii TaxID=427078 RepID=UPI000377A03A|nr:isochorismatase family cysteine hydrolase [Salsuginibacillus kocurii]